MEAEKLVGLRSYRKEESEIFYGREKEVEGLLQILQKDKLVTLIGAPGTGKSSLVNAGLIPRLEKVFWLKPVNNGRYVNLDPVFLP